MQTVQKVMSEASVDKKKSCNSRPHVYDTAMGFSNCLLQNMPVRIYTNALAQELGRSLARG